MTPTSTVAGTAKDAHATAEPSTLVVSTGHPGRWLGGAIGGLVSLAAALVATRIETGPSIFGWADWSMIGLLGVPIAFALGRALLPMARSEGWGRAISVGMLFGWIAPPLGAIEILGGSRLLGLANNSGGGPLALVLLPLAIPISFVAIFMTIPVGVAWGTLVRLIPDASLAALRVPPLLERVRVRHALVLIAAALILLELAVRA